MSHDHLNSRVATLLVWLLLMCVTPASAFADAPPQQSAHALLDVPYVAQTPELCGGAALAMVLRYWGERQVFPEDFQPLVVASERGIPTSALVRAVRTRDWQAVVVPADSADTHKRIHDAIDRGQPLIALIEVSANTYHYVVIVGATDREVVVHDPARSPFRVMPWDGFDRAWASAGRWMMLVLPPTSVTPGASPAARPVPSTAASDGTPQTPCDALVDRGVSLALENDKAAAEEALVGATRVCPAHASAWLELAGLRFSQSRLIEAEQLAHRAVLLAPDDNAARELLATSRYLIGDLVGALDAWSTTGEPRIDAVSVGGAERTRQPVVVNATGLQPRQTLTSESFRRALRRVQALPVAAGAALAFEPLEGGLARVNVSLHERDPYPTGWTAFGALGARAAIGREVRLETAGLFGAGERLSGSGRWQKERPRVALGLAAPSPSWLPGVVSIDGMWERQSYSDVRQSRRRTAFQISDWSTSWLRWRAGVALDRFDAHRFVSLEGGLDLRLARDRIALAAAGGNWFSTSGEGEFSTGAVMAAWRSTADTNAATWSALTEVTAANHAAPLAVWEGAGTGSARAGLLRAHPLLEERVLTGAVFGRRVARGTVEDAHPLGRTLIGNLSVAAFVDAARAWHRLVDGASPLFVDAGLGVRVRALGRADGIRVDVAHGLRGGGATLSVGWLGAWPR